MKILDVVPKEVFGDELNNPEHSSYILSGNYYEHYYEIAKKVNPKSIFEIGVRYGYSLCSMFVGCKTKDVQLYGWDNESYIKDSLKFAKHNLILCGANPKNIHLENTNSQDCKNLSKSFDLVHIDGDHSYNSKLHDLNLVKYNCHYLIIDDYEFMPDVKKACEYFINNEEHPKVLDTQIINSYRGTLFLEFEQLK